MISMKIKLFIAFLMFLAVICPSFADKVETAKVIFSNDVVIASNLVVHGVITGTVANVPSLSNNNTFASAVNTFISDVSVSSNLSVSGIITGTVAGVPYLSSNNVFSGNTNVFNGDMVVNGTLYTHTEYVTNLYVTNLWVINYVTNLYVMYDGFIGNDLTVSNNFTVLGSITGNTATVTNDFTVGRNLVVGGVITGNTAILTNNLTVNGNLMVDGTISGLVISLYGVAYVASNQAFTGLNTFSNLVSLSILKAIDPTLKTNSTAGSNLTIYATSAVAGSAVTNGVNGGAINIYGGSGVSQDGINGMGGSVNAFGGNSILGGGSVSLRGGGISGSTATGAYIYLPGGSYGATTTLLVSASSGNGTTLGNLEIYVRDQTTDNATTIPYMKIRGAHAVPGNGWGAAPGGQIDIFGGNGCAPYGVLTTASAGGAITIAGGKGGTNGIGLTVNGWAGPGGAVYLLGGTGGVINTASACTNGYGGVGGNAYVLGGNGGNAIGTNGTRTGGNGGNVRIFSGSGGTGQMANGTVGSIYLGVSGTTQSVFSVGTNYIYSDLALDPVGWAKNIYFGNNGHTLGATEAGQEAIMLKGGGTRGVVINSGGGASDPAIKFQLNGVEYMRIQSNSLGYVGINTNNPKYQLHVNGDAAVSNLYAAYSVNSLPPIQSTNPVAGSNLFIYAADAIAGSLNSNLVTASGGSIYIAAGEAKSGTNTGENAVGGMLRMIGGRGWGGTYAGQGGEVQLLGGPGPTNNNAGTGNGYGGNVTIMSGQGTGGGSSGNINIYGGLGRTPAGISGAGNINIYAEAGGSGSDTLGAITIATTNRNIASGTIGSIIIQGGAQNYQINNNFAGGPIKLITQKGCNRQPNSDGIAGDGGSMTFTLGTGGVALATNFVSTGGNGGLFAVYGAKGGNAASASPGVNCTNLGGSGSTIQLNAGAGGDSTSATGLRIGGNGGNIRLFAGVAGTGQTANGSAGFIAIGNGSFTNVLVQTSGIALGSRLQWLTGLGSITEILGASDQALGITVADKTQVAASVAGNGISLTAASAVQGSVSGSANGGNINLNAGAGAAVGTPGGDGGSISLSAGVAAAGNGVATGGTINVTAGSGPSAGLGGKGGDININAGASGANNAGGYYNHSGSVVLKVQDVVAYPETPGNILIQGGAASNIYSATAPTAGGTITVRTGKGNATSGGSGIAGGAGGAQSFVLGVGGAAACVTNSTGGAGGNFTVTGAAGGAASGTVGTNTGGKGSSINFVAGNGGSASGGGTMNGGDGGDVLIKSGSPGSGTTVPGAVGVVAIASDGKTNVVVSTNRVTVNTNIWIPNRATMINFALNSGLNWVVDGSDQTYLKTIGANHLNLQAYNTNTITAVTGDIELNVPTNGCVRARVGDVTQMVVSANQIALTTNTMVLWGAGTNANDWRMGPMSSTNFAIQVYDGANWTNAVLFTRPGL